METFAPYKTVEDTGVRLVLEEARWRQTLFIFLLRVAPIIITAIFFFGIANTATSNYVSVAVIIFFITYNIICLSIPYITKVEITSLGVVITYNSFFSNKEETIVIGDREKIVSRVRRGKQKALIYIVYKTSGKKRKLLSFHRFHMSVAKRDFVNSKLNSITNLCVQNL